MFLSPDATNVCARVIDYSISHFNSDNVAHIQIRRQ